MVKRLKNRESHKNEPDLKEYLSSYIIYEKKRKKTSCKIISMYNKIDSHHTRKS